MRLKTLAIACLLCLSTPMLADQEEIYFVCDLKDSNGKNERYSFVFREAEGYLFGIEGNKALSLKLVTSTQLKAASRNKVSETQYREMSFHLNRITGAGEISFLDLQRRNEHEIKECLERRGWGCKRYRILDMRTNRGECWPVKKVL